MKVHAYFIQQVNIRDSGVLLATFHKGETHLLERNVFEELQARLPRHMLNITPSIMSLSVRLALATGR